MKNQIQKYFKLKYKYKKPNKYEKEKKKHLNVAHI